MLVIVPFQPEHLPVLQLQAMQASAQPLMNLEHGRQIAQQKGLAYTALLDGEPIACAGMIELWKGRAYAWAYLSQKARRRFKTIHREVLRALQSAPWDRVEMAVDTLHGAGKRWAYHLGFDLEGIARKWTIDGRDVEIWARVR